MSKDESTEVPFPLVDLESICLKDDASDEEFLRIGKDIVKAFEEHGFSYLKNHGVSKEKLDECNNVFDEFFDLDLETKLKYTRNSNTMQGYMNSEKERFEHNYKHISFRESFDFQNFEEPLPVEVPATRDAIFNLIQSSVPMMTKLMKAIGFGLGVPDNLFEKIHSSLELPNSFGNLRLLRYSPVSKDIEDQLRFEEHVDVGGTATLQMCSDKDGLQVKDRNGKWHDSMISPDYFLVFPQKAMERWTSDRIPATMHRVLLPKSEESRKQYRHAIVYFIIPNKDVVIKPINGSDKYAPITVKEHIYEELRPIYREWD